MPSWSWSGHGSPPTPLAAETPWRPSGLTTSSLGAAEAPQWATCGRSAPGRWCTWTCRCHPPQPHRSSSTWTGHRRPCATCPARRRGEQPVGASPWPQKQPCGVPAAPGWENCSTRPHTGLRAPVWAQKGREGRRLAPSIMAFRSSLPSAPGVSRTWRPSASPTVPSSGPWVRARPWAAGRLACCSMFWPSREQCQGCDVLLSATWAAAPSPATLIPTSWLPTIAPCMAECCGHPGPVCGCPRAACSWRRRRMKRCPWPPVLLKRGLPGDPPGISHRCLKERPGRAKPAEGSRSCLLFVKQGGWLVSCEWC